MGWSSAARSRTHCPGALTVALGLVGIDLAHALEEIVHVGAIDFRCGRSAAGRGGHQVPPPPVGRVFLILVGHRDYSSAGFVQFQRGRTAQSSLTRASPNVTWERGDRAGFIGWFTMSPTTGMMPLSMLLLRTGEDVLDALIDFVFGREIVGDKAGSS